MLEEKIKELAYQRVLREEIRASYQLTLETFNQNPVVVAYEKAKRIVEQLETEVREEALKLFTETGEKKPHEAVEIKEISKISPGESIPFEVVEKDGTKRALTLKERIELMEKKALEYVKKELPQALVLDRKVFDKVMKALPEENLPDGVKIEKVPSAYISTELSKFLE